MASTTTSSADSPTDIPALLRFLTQSASVPLSDAMRLIPALQRAKLTTTSSIASAPLSEIRSLLFPEDEKAAKQLHNAAKRASGGAKRKNGADAAEGAPTGQRKKRRTSPIGEGKEPTTAEAEAELALPVSEIVDEAVLRATVLFTNRAPLLLAFAVVLLKHTMPTQPLSSRLSLAQAMVSTGARARAVTLGLEKSGPQEEGWERGQPSVRVLGKEVKVLRRWGYEVGESDNNNKAMTAAGKDEISNSSALEGTLQANNGEKSEEDPNVSTPVEPPLWGLDLEALKKSNGPPLINASSRANTSGLPIYTPQSARSYLMKSFATANVEPPNKPGTKKDMQEKTRNLGLLLVTLELLYESWSSTMSKEDLDRRAWSWYVAVRPEVEDGPRGWGGKSEVRLKSILDLRRSLQ